MAASRFACRTDISPISPRFSQNVGKFSRNIFDFGTVCGYDGHHRGEYASTPRLPQVPAPPVGAFFTRHCSRRACPAGGIAAGQARRLTPTFQCGDLLSLALIASRCRLPRHDGPCWPCSHHGESPSESEQPRFSILFTDLTQLARSAHPILPITETFRAGARGAPTYPPISC